MGKKIWLSIQARKFGYDVTLRSFVRTLRVGVSRNESLSSPLESFVSKGFRNDWQIRICQLSKCLVEFRSRPFNFWGGYREFQKKIFCSTEFERKKACKEVTGKNNILHWKKYRSWRIMLKKKILHRYMSGKKFLPKLNHPYPLPTNVQWSCQPFRGCGKKQIWHLGKCHPSTKWLAHVHHLVVFKTKVLHFKIESTPVKDTNGKKSSKECSVSSLWTNESFSLWNCLSWNSTVFSTQRIGALGLFWTNQGSEVSEDTWGTFRTLWSKKSTFLKGNFCIYKGFMDVF